jgi:hypothetical protein
MEIKAVMAMLRHNFLISKPEGTGSVGEQFSFTMMPTNLFIRFQARTT